MQDPMPYTGISWPWLQRISHRSLCMALDTALKIWDGLPAVGERFIGGGQMRLSVDFGTMALFLLMNIPVAC